MQFLFTGCTDNTTHKDCNDCNLRWDFSKCAAFRQATGRDLIEKGRVWAHD